MDRVLSLFLAVALFSPAVLADWRPGTLPPLTRIKAPEPADRSRMPTDGSEAKSVHYVYRNDGDQAVTAWRFRCVVAMNDGRAGWTGSGADIFGRGFANNGEDPISWIQPGENLEFHQGIDFKRDGPYAVQSCGLVAVVMEDGTSHGSPEVLESILARRRSLVVDARSALAGIDAILDGEITLAGERDFSAALANLPGNGIFDSYLAPVVTQSHRTGRPATDELQELRGLLQAYLEDMLAHLQPADREQIGEAR